MEVDNVGGGSGDGGEAVPGSVLIFTRSPVGVGGEESVTGSVLKMGASPLLFLCFFSLDFLKTSSNFSFFQPFFFFSACVFATIFFNILLTLGSTATPASTVEEELAWGNEEVSTTRLDWSKLWQL